MVIHNCVFEIYTIFYLNGSAATFNECLFLSWTVIETTEVTIETSQSIENGNHYNPGQKGIVLQDSSFSNKVYINVDGTVRKVIIHNCGTSTIELRLGTWTRSLTYVWVKATDSVFSGEIDLLSGYNSAILVEFIACICKNKFQIDGWSEVVMNFSDSTFKETLFIHTAGIATFANCSFQEKILIQNAVNFTFTNSSFLKGVQLEGSTSTTTVTITNCRFSQGGVIIISKGRVSLKQSRLSNTLLDCSEISIQVIDSLFGNMKIYEAGNVDIINSIGGFVKIEGKDTGKCCSNVTVANSRLKHSGLDCKKVSLNITDCIVTKVIWDSYHGSRFTAVDTVIAASMKSEYVRLFSVTRNTSVFRDLRFICPLKLVEDKDTKAEKVMIHCDSCEEDEYKVSIPSHNPNMLKVSNKKDNIHPNQWNYNECSAQPTHNTKYKHKEYNMSTNASYITQSMHNKCKINLHPEIPPM